MKKLVLSLTLCFVLAVPVFSSAQQPTDDSVAPDKADILQFLDMMHTKTQMAQVLEGMEKQMRLGAEQGFKSKVPNATPEQLAKVDQLFDGIFKPLPIGEMMDALVPIYQKHLTKADLAAITAFYSSPTGQKVLKEMPAITSEAMQAGGEIGRRAFATRSQELDQKIAELVKETKGN
ncbi:MAG TPA: DUF2059 domain-containing protein [Terriglobales bacterium]|nr:DUF2059 domain-containing protein [Terriglobales bacterium]